MAEGGYDSSSLGAEEEENAEEEESGRGAGRRDQDRQGATDGHGGQQQATAAASSSGGAGGRGPEAHERAPSEPEDTPQQLRDSVGEAVRRRICKFRTTSGECTLGDRCADVHGDRCDLCQTWCLDPGDESQRARHREECARKHEEDMECPFERQRSGNKECGICMEAVIDKEPASARRFGILENCGHVFCIGCIRKWRRSRGISFRTVRSCPICAAESVFVVASSDWVDPGPEKERLIAEYKSAMRAKQCEHFGEGRGRCPFGGACLSRHALPDGPEVVLPPPPPRTRSTRHQRGEEEELMRLMQLVQIIRSANIWDFAASAEPDVYQRIAEILDLLMQLYYYH